MTPSPRLLDREAATAPVDPREEREVRKYLAVVETKAVVGELEGSDVCAEDGATVEDNSIDSADEMVGFTVGAGVGALVGSGCCDELSVGAGVGEVVGTGC